MARISTRSSQSGSNSGILGREPHRCHRSPGSTEMRDMPRAHHLETGSPWVELSTTDDDWKAADPALLGTMLAELHLIRAFEETVLELAGEGLVHGPAHSSIGQESGAVGSIVGLRSSDQVNGSHRGHHQFLAKALAYVAPHL